ncbi:helicase-related protein [Vibrio vulnificus]|nr:DEAD/DEAH box helicase [Vibrio vulnificus]
MNVDISPKDFLAEVVKQESSPFQYLKQANTYLSSPMYRNVGREYVIRALNELEIFEKNAKLLKDLVRKAGLYPYLNKYFKSIADDVELDVLLPLYQSAANPDFIFHSMQAKIFNLLVSGKNVVLSAPTSMGKSAIVDSLIASGKYSKIVIVVPTIALIDETRRRILKNFGKYYQVIHHGSQVLKKGRAIYVLTQERVNERTDLENIDLFVVDEFYKLAFSNEEKSRAIALNIALSKLLTTSKQFYMIGPYIDFVRGIENLSNDYVFIPSEFNTVALNIHELNLRPKDDEGKQEKLRSILKNNDGQTIIYCQSQNSIDKVVCALDDAEPSYPMEVKRYQRWLEHYYRSSWSYNRALSKGVAIHHGALPRAIQQKSVELFNSKKVKYLICTSTLIEGVNTVAENVVIYDNRKSTTSIDSFTHRNISGRAGRMNTHLVGNVFCMEALPKEELSSNVVELPLGQQDEDTPVNLLAGIEQQHLSELGQEYLQHYNKRSNIPLELIKKHASYQVERVEEGYELITEMSVRDMKVLSQKSTPEGVYMDLVVRFIKKVEFGSLQKLNLHFEDDNSLKNRINWYIYADRHSDYIRDRLGYIYQAKAEAKFRSEDTDREFKIARNIFKFAIPRALTLLQDLLNFEFEQLELDNRADFGYLIHRFENSHLSASFSALEEMGVAIETLEKIQNSKLENAEIDTLVRYIRRYYKEFEELNFVDRMFIEQALIN